VKPQGESSQGKETILKEKKKKGMIKERVRTKYRRSSKKNNDSYKGKKPITTFAVAGRTWGYVARKKKKKNVE